MSRTTLEFAKYGMPANAVNWRHVQPETMIYLNKKYLLLNAVAAVLYVTLCASLPVSAVSCSPLSGSEGTASATFTVSTSGTYKLWAHVYAASSGSQSLSLTVDKGCPLTVSNTTTSGSTFSWLGGNPDPVSVVLAQGTHSITVAGGSPSIGVDRILLTTDSSCTPAGSGSNCIAAATVQPKTTKTNAPKSSSTTKKPSILRMAAYGSIAAIVAFLLFYALARRGLLGRFIHFKFKNRSVSQQSDSAANVVMNGAQPTEHSLTTKRSALFAVVCAVVCGLIAALALAATNNSIVIDFSNATTAGSAKIVSNTSAVNGQMVQFGPGSSTAPSATGAPATQTSSTPKPNPTPPSGSSGGSGSGSSGGGSGSGVSSSNCTNPSWSSSDPQDTDPIGSNGLWWVNNDAWSGSHGPQSIYVCDQSSWYAVSNQTDNGGQVETYPDTEYDVGGRDSPSTKTIAQWSSITSTFSENFPTQGSWDAGYDLWTNNWTNETMIWNQWQGSQAYWYTQATTSVTLGGVAYKFIDNGGELIFMRVNQVQSGSVDILAAWNWEVAHGYAQATDVPTQLEYGVEVCATNGNETFPMTGLTFSLN